MADSKKSILFQWDGVPSVGELIPLSLQHVVAAVVGIITPAIIIAGVCNLASADKTLLIQVSLVMSGLVTILQAYPLFDKFGAGLPIIMGTSFAYVPTLQAIGAANGIGAILGAELIGGIVAVLFGFFFKKIRVLFPNVVTGTVVLCIGLS
ncbi:solute carrier family 23 protein, partial [Lancefieldella parvula]|uniref:solute carrier family 23 protein n=1 Tax=Lancefieldella parvula TaxID=1382 RepID=UPI0028D494A4